MLPASNATAVQNHAKMSTDWELVKENAQPLKGGYKMSALSSLLQSPTQSSKLKEEQRWVCVLFDG